MPKRSGAAIVFLAVALAAPRAALPQRRPPARAPAGPASAPGSAPAAPSAQPAPGPRPAELSAAIELFTQGNALLEAGQFEPALDLFLRSRGLVPSISNTSNAAVCLERLGRSDEALDLYEQLLTGFAATLTEEERGGVAAKIAALRSKVGAVDISANVMDGALIVDGRRRGQVPLAQPLRLTAGAHVVRVLKEGFAPAEAEVKVVGGQTARVDLKLEVLSSTGRLKVTDAAGGAGVEVLVDGSPVGAAPWEGTLGPGRHLVWLRGKDAGSAPQAVNVLVGQAVPVELRSMPLGPPWRVESEPRSAALAIDGVEIGKGSWQGRLPLGAHTVEVYEEGYVTEAISFAPGGAAAARVTLVRDEDHPRWRQGARARLRLDALVGFGVTPGLGGDAEASCPSSCSSSGASSGPLAGARLAYVLPQGLRLEVGGGYLRVSGAVDRSKGGLSFHDDLSVGGPYAALGLAYGVPREGRIQGVGRLSVGALFARARDGISGRDASGTELAVSSGGKASHAADVYAAPELGLEAAFGKLRLGLGVGVSFFLLDGPSFEQGETGVSRAPPACPTPTSRGCAKGSAVVAGERAYGRFVMVQPQLNAGWVF